MQTLKNHVMLIGNLGTNPEITNFENGNKIARFRMATNGGPYKNRKSKTEWHQVFAWGNIARFIETHAHKGKQLAIHGRLVTRTYLNSKGIEREIKEVEIRHVIGL